MADHSAVGTLAPTVSSCVDATASLSLQGASLLERLPTELLRQILEDVVPQPLMISFTKYYTSKKWRPKTIVAAYDPSVCKIVQQSAYASLLRTSKRISREAGAILYANNRFLFCTDVPLPNKKFSKTTDHVLRSKRDVHLLVEETQEVAEHKSFLEHILSVISAHSRDDSKTPLLQHVEVKVQVRGCDELSVSVPEHSQDYLTPQYGNLRSIELCKHTLDVLSKLSKICPVKISRLPDWHSRCLQVCIQGGQGVDVPDLRRSKKKVGTIKSCAAYGKSERCAGECVLEWSNFAQKYNITMPKEYLHWYTQHNGRYYHLTIKDRVAATSSEQI